MSQSFYLKARTAEGRLLPDDAVLQLPNTSKSSPYAQEWLWRKRSLARLQGHLARRFEGRELRLLDLGCGNGWMSRRMAENTHYQVLGVDVNQPELAQAQRLFVRDNLQFASADVMQDGLGQARFDVLLLAASAQYFPDFEALMRQLRAYTATGGEIHVFDTRFYPNEKEALAARQRTLAYYAQLGVPEMAQFYHHHTREAALRTGGCDMNNALKIKFLQKIKWLPPLNWFCFQAG